MHRLKRRKYTLILASASPRRQELLRNAGIEFTVQPAYIPETRQPHESPPDYARRLASEKARHIFREFSKSDPGVIVLGADTVVVIDNQVLGKPENQSEAASMLRKLSGKTHQVISAICFAYAKGERVAHEITKVDMNEISEEQIKTYVASGEPMDKAGAYAIQGSASKWIPRIEGCYFNVVGLPVARVWQLLQEIVGEK